MARLAWPLVGLVAAVFVLGVPSVAQELTVRGWIRSDQFLTMGPATRMSVTFREWVELERREFGSGFAWGIAVAGWQCARGFDGPTFAAYMVERADPSAPFAEAARAFLAERGCRPGAGPDPAEWRRRAEETAMADLLAALTIVRESSEPEKLRRAVENARQPGATNASVLLGLVAGARLLELETQSKQPPAWHPQQSAPR